MKLSFYICKKIIFLHKRNMGSMAHLLNMDSIIQGTLKTIHKSRERGQTLKSDKTLKMFFLNLYECSKLTWSELFYSLPWNWGSDCKLNLYETLNAILGSISTRKRDIWGDLVVVRQRNSYLVWFKPGQNKLFWVRSN